MLPECFRDALSAVELLSAPSKALLVTLKLYTYHSHHFFMSLNHLLSIYSTSLPIPPRISIFHTILHLQSEAHPDCIPKSPNGLL